MVDSTRPPTAQDDEHEHPILGRVAAPPDRTSSYGPHARQVYDVRLPPGTAREVTVVVVHGGFWRAAVDRAHAGSQAVAYALDGFHVAVPDYRGVGMPGGGWPGTFDDARDALAAIRDDPELPDQVVLVGHSAGGHLAVWLLSQAEGSGARGAVSLAGCLDLGLVARERLGDDAVIDLLEGWPEDVDERYAVADTARLVPAPAPVLLVHGESDTVVPPAISRSYQRISAAAGRDAPLTTVRSGHFELIDPDDPAFGAGFAALRELADAD